MDPRVMEQKVHVARVIVEGQQRTRDFVTSGQVKNVFEAKNFGEMTEAVAEASARLKSLGVFKSVEAVIDAVPDSLDGKVVHFFVKEGRSITGSTGLDVGSNEGVARAKMMVRNILGLADKLCLEFSKTSAGSTTTDMSFKVPVPGLPFTEAGIDATQFDMSFNTFSQRTHSLGAVFQGYSSFGHHTVKLETAWREIGQFKPEASLRARMLGGSSLKNSLSHIFKFDGRDDDLNGTTATVTTEVAGLLLGGEAHHLKTDVHAKHLFQLGNGFALSVGAMAGHIQGLKPQSPLHQELVNVGGASLAPSREHLLMTTFPDRFLLGGPLNVRGFERNGLGQRDGKDSLGGTSYAALGASLYVPLPTEGLRRAVSDSVKIHLFGNTGSLVSLQTQPLSRTHPFEDLFHRIRESAGASVGLGLAFVGSNFQFEVNYCLPVRSPPQARKVHGIQFGLGFEFL